MEDTKQLGSILKLYRYYKDLGEKTFSQLEDQHLFWTPNEDSNSIAVIVKHLRGNMLSRWTDFLEIDGEKTWRHRDTEFESTFHTRTDMMEAWNEGWDCFFSSVEPLSDKDLDRIIYIRNIGHSVRDGLHRQLAHYASHVGQILYIGKMLKGSDWVSLSIPKGKSKEYNEKKFTEQKKKGHFTDEFLK